MTIEEVKQLACKKHIKIYKLNQAGLTNKAIAEALETNPGHVYNALKLYKGNEKKITEANQITLQ